MDISIIEFVVYGLIAYSSVIILAVSMIKENQATRSQSLARVMYLIPGLIAALILAGSGVNIVTETGYTITETDNIINGTSGTAYLNHTITTTIPDRTYTLLNPVWIIFHYMIAIVFFIYIIIQILSMLLFKE